MTPLQEQLLKEVTEAYVFLRENNNTVPSETLEIMLEASKRAILGEEYTQQSKPSVSDKEKIKLSGLKSKLELSVKNIESMNEDMDGASWGYEEGIIISGNQAKTVLKLLTNK